MPIYSGIIFSMIGTTIAVSLLDSPVAGGVRGDATQVHPPGAMLDEYQDIQPP
jgi:hypothetical protein